MANILAAQNGNFNASSTWTGGVVPGVGDTAYANTRTVTITADVTCDKLSTRGDNGATAGGGFAVSVSGLTVTAAIEAGATTCLTSTVASPGTLAINGNCTAGTSVNAHGFFNTGTGTITILGDAFGGTGGTSGGNICIGVYSANGIVNITGTATGGNGGVGTHGIYAIGGTINFTGDAIGGSGGNPGYGIMNASSGATVNMTGNATGGSRTGNAGAYNAAAGTFSITGNVTGGTSSAYGAANALTGTLNITGIAYASALASGAFNASSGVLRVTRAVGNTGGIANTGVGPVAGLASNNVQSLTYVQQLEFGSSGASPTSGCIYLTNNTNNLVDFPLEGGGRKTVVDVAGASGFLPAVTDVRLGVSYNQGLNTGTLAVPPAGSVAFGVPVDNTTGTATITASDIRAAIGLASANLDAQLDALPTAPENAAAVRTELTTELGRIDASVSSRLSPSGTLARVTLTDTTTALTDVSNIVSGVWAATTRTLSDVSNIVSGVWSAATRTVTGGTIDSVANLDAPTEAEIAAAVRTELATELGRIDVATSTRLAPDGTLARVTLTDTVTTLTNDAPLNEEAIADAVRTELTPELERLANASTTQEVAEIVEGALSQA